MSTQTPPSDGDSQPTGMSTQARALAIVGAILVVVLAVWLTTRGQDEPAVDVSASSSSTQTPAATVSPSPAANEPGSTTSPTPPSPSLAPSQSPSGTATDPSTAPTDGEIIAPVTGDLVVGTDDGVVVVSDGQTSVVPGTQGSPVDIAFATSDGSLVFQSRPEAIDAYVDGSVSSVVEITDFADISDDGATLSPHSITLMDLDTTTATMVFTVDYRNGESSTSADRTQSIVSNTDGSGNEVVRTDALFGGGTIEHSLGGGLRTTILATSDDASLTVWDGTAEVPTDWETDWDPSDPSGSPALGSPQLDDTGDRVALTSFDSEGTWEVLILETITGTVESRRALDAGFIPLDLTDTHLIVKDPIAETSVLVDVATDSFQTVPGRATIVR